MELIEFIREYVKEYNNEVKEEYGHSDFDDYSDADKGSISAINLLLARAEQFAEEKRNNDG